ncbi:DUF4012 domain-containing protein [Nocardioides piscis]|uniref:DUF4012 domain-containing protein n=1 Tax=Nocardioides piscis TaxID=2714938 RepID=A0A6G7YF10_9ACTN|nr:DUF4012 domain-containing protein [Nocardioides piscis]QIK75266.1 DUF4012 domain-containing protein [Nocardioides piscis]
MRSLSSLRKPVVLLAAAAGVVAIGVSLARVPGAAEGARAELDAAAAAIQAGDPSAATEAVDRARDDVDVVQVGLQGPAGVLGQWLPVVGTSVNDARQLGDALDALTTAAELGAGAAPELTGPGSTFFTGDRVDIPTLRRLTDTAVKVRIELTRAGDSLNRIDGTGPGGGRIDGARDEALARVVPLREGLESAEPLLEELPGMLGADGQRKYLVAILNPAELLYSGGTALSYAPLTVDDGSVEVGETVDGTTGTGMFGAQHWRKVKGNPFHRGRLKVPTAAKAPSWPVSGEEMLNAWRSIRGRNMAGLIAIDVVALGRLTEITGPIDVAGFGRIEPGGLVEAVVGSYDEFEDTNERRALNRSLVPVFRDQLFNGGDLAEKISILNTAAQGRHFALFFRDDAVQAAADELGMTGDLSDTKHDYLGVFTQNAVASKTDYWQKRVLRSRVQLAPDGSAEVRLRVDIHNDTPPYAFAGADPRTGYATRWLNASIGAFLPKGAKVSGVSVRGNPVDFVVGDYFGRPFVRQTVVFPPQSRGDLVLTYEVPAAAVVGEGGSLSYRLDADPQGMVNPQGVDVTVTWPKGFVLGDVPEDWRQVDRRTARWREPALESSPSFELTARTP